MQQFENELSYEVEQKRNFVIEEYYFQITQIEKYYNRDQHAALLIQHAYKKHKDNVIRNLQEISARIIQTQIRKYLSNLRFKKIYSDKINKQTLNFFDYEAIIIQKTFRGYYNRKFVHDYYARKQFLNMVKIQNEGFKEELDKYQSNEQEREQEHQKQVQQEQFSKLASNLHHLTSTHIIPGVYNPPYADEKPKAFDVDIETHLKTTFKSNYQWKPANLKSIKKFGVVMKYRNTQYQPQVEQQRIQSQYLKSQGLASENQIKSSMNLNTINSQQPMKPRTIKYLSTLKSNKQK